MHTAARILLLAALAGLAVALPEKKWDRIHARWSMGNLASYTLGSGFFNIPSTKADAVKDKWVQARGDDTTSLWCLPDDPRVCTIYDKLGSIAGMQVCFPQEDLAYAPYKWWEHKQFVTDKVFGVDVACGRFYLVPQETLQTGRSSFSEVGSGLWIQEGDSIVEMPVSADEMVKQGWTKESCIPSMGRHYYYNISTTMDCQSMEPYFLLTDASLNKLHALGFQSFGRKTKKDRMWMEDVPAIAVRPTIPNTPQCLIDWASDYGVLSLHVYFTSLPFLITCPLFG